MAKKTNFAVNGKKYFKVSRTVGRKADGTAIRKVFYGTGNNFYKCLHKIEKKRV